MMRNKTSFRLLCSLSLIVIALNGCNRHVAAAPPAATPLQSATPVAPLIMLRATPATIDRGEATSLQWEAKNAASVRIEPEIGNVQVQGARSINPTSSVTYVATATGPGGGCFRQCTYYSPGSCCDSTTLEPPNRCARQRG